MVAFNHLLKKRYMGIKLYVHIGVGKQIEVIKRLTEVLTLGRV